jgi:hypothetical protein
MVRKPTSWAALSGAAEHRRSGRAANAERGIMFIAAVVVAIVGIISAELAPSAIRK